MQKIDPRFVLSLGSSHSREQVMRAGTLCAAQVISSCVISVRVFGTVKFRQGKSLLLASSPENHTFCTRTMPYDPESIANEFLDLAQKRGMKLSNMQLQKLVYFAHGWHLAIKNEPLINVPVKAWTFGPVIPPLYNKLKGYGRGAVSAPIPTQADMGHDEFVQKFLQRMFDLYGKLTAFQLSALSHEKGSPWDTVYNIESSPFGEIPNAVIRSWFHGKLKPVG